MQFVMGIVGTIIKIMADLGITKIIHTCVQNIFKGHEIKKTTKACVYVGEFMAVAVIGKQNDKLVDDSLDKVAKFMVKHDLDKKLGLDKLPKIEESEKENAAGEQHSDELRIV